MQLDFILELLGPFSAIWRLRDLQKIPIPLAKQAFFKRHRCFLSAEEGLFFSVLTRLIVASWGKKKKKKPGGDVLFSFTFCVQSCEGRFHFFSSAIKNTVQGFLLSFHTRNEVRTKPSLLELF